MESANGMSATGGEMARRATIERMSQRNYDKQPTEYGGVRDNSRNPITGRPTPRSASQQAPGMRREAIRGQGALPKQDRRAPNRGF